MSRFFDGSGAYVQCSVGATAAGGTGAYTIISLIKLPLFVGASGVISLRGGGGFRRTFLVADNGHLFGASDFSDGFGPIVSDEWWWIVQRKLAGSQHYEFAIAQYPVADPDTDITFGESNNSDVHGDPGSGDEVWLGLTDIPARGDHGLNAWFNAYLSNADIKSALTEALTDIMALDPAGCWPMNQATEDDPVSDVTNNGADEIAVINGPIPVSDDPPGYDFALTPPVTDLVIANAAHVHSAQNVTLTQAHNLAVASAGHAHTAQGLVLTQVHKLTVASTAHTITSTTIGNLTPDAGTVSGAAVANPALSGSSAARPVVALAGTIE